MKNVYLYDKDTLVFIGKYQAQESPLEKGVFLEPISSTSIKPPTAQSGFKQVFEDGIWVEVKLPVEPEPTKSELDAITYAQAKQDKILAVSQITVTTALGKVFDGDEISQNRMARAVTASNAGDTTQWILADNTQATVTHEELKEALLLAGEATIKIWMT